MWLTSDRLTGGKQEPTATLLLNVTDGLAGGKEGPTATLLLNVTDGLVVGRKDKLLLYY